EAGRSPGAVSDQVRDGGEPQDRQGAWSYGAAIDLAACRRDDRIRDLATQNGLIADGGSRRLAPPARQQAPEADAPPRQSAEERADAALLVTSRQPGNSGTH